MLVLLASDIAYLRHTHKCQSHSAHKHSHLDLTSSAALLYLACRVLQGLLCSISGTNRRSSSTVSAKVIALARNQPLQYALLTCAVEVTCFCGTGQASFPSIASALGQAPAALDLWEAAQHFLFFLAAETAMPLADSVGSYLIFMRMRVMEDLAWRTGSTLYSAICNGGGASCKQGDYALVSAFLESVAALARTRVTGTAAGVMHHIMALNEVAAFQEECIWLMDIVLQEHLDLLFNQHLSNIAACCVYGVARVYGAALTFKKVVDTVIATFPHHTVEDFKQAELQPADEQAEAQYGDTRQLYNEVFLPRMDTVLQQKFAGAQQKNKRSCVDIGKEKQETHKRALKALSAADVNARPGRFHRMQT